MLQKAAFWCLAGVVVLAPVAVAVMPTHVETAWAIPLALAGTAAIETNSPWRREAFLLMLLGLVIPAGSWLVCVAILPHGSNRLYVSPVTILLAAAVAAAVLAEFGQARGRFNEGTQWGRWIVGAGCILGVTTVAGYAVLSRRYSLEWGFVRGALFNMSLFVCAWMGLSRLPNTAMLGRIQRVLLPLALCLLAALGWLKGSPS